MKSRFIWEAIGVTVLTFIVTLAVNDFYLLPGVKQGLIAITVIAQAFLVLMAILLLWKPSFLDEIRASAREFAFMVAFVATAGSLFYSNIAGYTPCTLCWYQRIFMYPLVLIIGISFWKWDEIKRYVVPMTGIGGAIAIYHYVIQVMKTSTGCAAQGGADCAVPWIFHLGYITIPMMALTAFLLITVMLYLEMPKEEAKQKKKKSEKKPDSK